MSKTTILNIATGIVALAIIYMLIFEETRHNRVFWGVLATFFLLQLGRRKQGKERSQD